MNIRWLSLEEGSVLVYIAETQSVPLSACGHNKGYTQIDY